MHETNLEDRVSDLIKETGMSLQELADETGISKPSLGNYSNGKTPNTTALLKLCQYFGVSADYLLCLTNIKSPSTTIQAIHKQTNLTEEAITTLSNSSTDIVSVLSEIIIHPDFKALISRMIQLKSLTPDVTEQIYAQNIKDHIRNLFNTGKDVTPLYSSQQAITDAVEFQITQIFSKIIKDIAKEEN